MAGKLLFNTHLQKDIALDAWWNAWKVRCCFDAPSFAKKYGYKDSRYLRSVLKAMVGKGILYSFVGDNRHVYYCAQETGMMEIFEREMK